MERNFVDYPQRCPELRQTVFYPFEKDKCNLNNKSCIFETSGECPTYEDWLFEERQEELDHPEEYRVISSLPFCLPKSGLDKLLWRCGIIKVVGDVPY